jgi:hypothetical protein
MARRAAEAAEENTTPALEDAGGGRIGPSDGNPYQGRKVLQVLLWMIVRW